MNLSYLDPRPLKREALWFAAGVALLLAAAWLVPTYVAGLVAAIVPTLAMVSASSRSLLPALLFLAISTMLAATGAELALEVGLLGVALALIFAVQRAVERMQARAMPRGPVPGASAAGSGGVT